MDEPDYEGIHTCSYACMRPGCIEYQRNELFRKLEAERAVNAALKEVIDKLIEGKKTGRGSRGPNMGGLVK